MGNCGRVNVFAGLLVAVLLVTGGCSASRGDYAEPASVPMVLTNAQPQDTTSSVAAGPPMEVAPQPLAPPTAYTEAPQLQPAPPAPGAAAPSATALLSPSEKARVIAELEALARAQATPAAPSIVEPCTPDPQVVAALPQPPTPEQMAALCAAAASP